METKHNSDSELGMLRGVLLGEIDSEGKRLKVCLISTFIFGLIAHAYGFLHLLIGHDSLHEFYWSVSRDWKLILGRFVEPLLRYLLGEIIVLPWLAGLTGLLFVALAVHLISKMFQLNKVWETLLLSGICTTNVTVTAIIATYAHDFTGDMMALLLCTMATYAWYQMRSRFSWKYTVLGTFCLAAAFGLYQAYLAVMTTVLCIWSVLELLHGTPAKTTIMRLLRALPMILLAVVLYLACVFATRQLYHIVAFSGEPANDISVVGENLLRFKELVIQGYRQVARDLFRPHWNSVKGVHYRASALVSVVNMVLCLHTAWTLLTIIKKKALKKAQIILIFGLLLLLPLAMTCVSIISTAFHNLLRYAYYLFYLLVVAVFCVGRNTSSIKQPGRQGMLIAGLICIVLLNNVQVSNAVYEKKELEQRATFSTMTRVLSSLEQYEDYVHGETPVALIGNVGYVQKPLQVKTLYGIVGQYSSPITSPKTVEDYFDIVLQYPIQICSEEEMTRIVDTEEFKQMGIFPEKNCISTIDGIVVIKMPE